MTTQADVILYTRTDCHLCDDALQLLRQHGLTPECVDIDAHPELQERFDTCVPVVEIDGRIRFRGRIEPVLLRRLLSAMGTGSSQDFSRDFRASGPHTTLD